MDDRFAPYHRIFDIQNLAVAQWIVHMPPKRGIQVRFLSAGPSSLQSYPQDMWIN